MGQPLLIACTVLITTPCATTVSGASPPSARTQFLSGVQHPKYCVKHHWSTQQEQPEFPVAYSGIIASPRARPSSALMSVSARNLDLPHTTNSTWQIAHSCSWICARHLGLAAAGLCVAARYAVREGMVGIVGTRLRSSDLHTELDTYPRIEFASVLYMSCGRVAIEWGQQGHQFDAVQ
ncbi:hypothetical protein B0H19DRAFT_1313031 [Mycena capillaripes]|nr:hypothetical protein B0H19DRAFT_1313031 [Mycena capillaripes]